MNKGYYHTKTQQHGNNTGNRSTMKHSPYNNSTKFQNQAKEDKNAKIEIDEWFNKNKDADIQLISHIENKFVLSMVHDGKKHIIEIVYPKSYPEVKKGFSCKEQLSPGGFALNFISKANEQFENKVLSIERVITHLAKTFGRYKDIKKIEASGKTINSVEPTVVFNTNAKGEPED